MSRKTIDVAEICEWVNTRLACPDSTLDMKDWTPEQAFRMGAASLYEQIALATGNYSGFTYQGSEFLPAEQQTPEQVLRDGYDESRRRYIWRSR